MAILGPSGSGKTTFIDILNGRKNTGHVYGEILINGQPRNKSFKRISGYVLQDDRMLGTLTVKEHLTYVALLRLPSLMPYEMKMRRVEQVMEDLGISHIADNLIGTEMSRGISGGERRRLSIASELVTDPSILFLDEPTSGLDSYNAYTLMETLKRLAKDKNRTVVMSIHQPRSNIFLMFDNLLLLSHGEMVYFGPAQEAVDHMAGLGHQCPRNFNPADYLIDLVTMNSVGVIRSLAQSYRETNQASDITSQISNIQNEIDLTSMDVENMQEYASFWWTQVWVLSRRTLLNNMRNPYLLRTQYCLTFILAGLLGTIYWHVRNDITGIQDRAGVLFFLISLLSFGSMSSIDIFFQERVLFLRERANGMYRTSAYFVAKTLCDVVPMRVIPPIILGTIVYFMVGLHPSLNAFFYFLLILILISLVASSMCLAISAFTPSLSLGNLIAILLLLFYMLFGGFLVNKQSMPPFIQWLKWVSFLNYGFEVLLVNELNGLTIRFQPKGYHINSAVNLNGKVFLDQFDMDPARFHTDLWALGGMAVGYLLFTYILLRWAVREKR
jgi:ABC-type multidrug transport system ATPase subunit